MRLLQVNKLYYPHIGGVESIVRQISEALNKREDFDMKVLCCAKDGKMKEETINELVYTIAKRLDSTQKGRKVFIFSASTIDRKKRYIQLKTFRELKKLYGIQGTRAAKDKDRLHLKRI